MRKTLCYKNLLTTLLGFYPLVFLLAQDGLIKGKVANVNENLPGATVSLGTKTMLTNINGEFSFSVKAGSYPLVITHAGYKKIEDSVSVKAGSTQILNYILIPVEQLGEVVALASRSRIQRSNLTTPVPIDVFSSAHLAQTGQISLTQMLNVIAPSFNASREVLNEPATLRGLDPQHVLILLNGIRYHNTASLFKGNLKGQLGRGSVGNDLNSIPFSAIEKIEILRDGASGQFGSDAIAGVINVQLKQSIGKTSIQLHAGQFYEGDGEKFSIGINRGIPIGKSLQGFLNFSASYRYQAPTYRGGEYSGTVYYDTTKKTYRQRDSLLALDNQKVPERGFNRRAVLDNVGNTKQNRTGFLMNGGYTVRNHTELFWTAAVNARKLDRGGAYSFPKDTSRVNLVLYPDGFQARLKSNMVDVSVIAGVKIEEKNNWHWDFSSSYGINSVKSYSSNTNNASQSYMGVNAPTSFYNGKDIYKLLTNDINIAKSSFKLPGQMKTLNLGWGAEWRLENYHSIEGEEASYENYDTTNKTQPGVGSIRPENAVNKSRHTLGAYCELEGELTNHFLFNVAGRYEYYSDFGGNFAAKLAARYKFSDQLSLRASINNGFRAPSLQQRYLNTIQRLAVNSGGARTFTISGIFPNDHPVIKALDIPSLTAEKTINVSGGFTSTISNRIALTVDAYWIQIKDRIVFSGTFERKTGSTLDSILDNYPQFNQVSRVSFFSNAINTRTKGIDFVLNGIWKIHKTSLNISLAANFNSTRLYGDIKTSDKLASSDENSKTLLNIEERTKIEKGQPCDKIILSITYKTGKTKLIIRNTRFGRTSIAPLFTNPSRVIDESFSPKILTDINLSYSLKEWVTLSLGANNIFDVYPDRLKNYENTNQGSWIYSPEASPLGFNGGYYFAGISFNF